MRSGWGFLVCKLFDGLKEMSSLPIREQDSYSFIFLFVSDLLVTMFVSFFIVDAEMPFYVSFYQISTKMLNVHIDNLTCCFTSVFLLALKQPMILLLKFNYKFHPKFEKLTRIRLNNWPYLVIKNRWKNLA